MPLSCAIEGCLHRSQVYYMGHRLCNEHYKVARGDMNAFLAEHLGQPIAPTVKELGWGWVAIATLISFGLGSMATKLWWVCSVATP